MGKPQIFGSSFSTGPRPLFSLGWDFMIGLGKHHQPANLEVAIFSRCRNIKREPQYLRELPYLRVTPTFSSGCDFMMTLGKPKLHTKFEVDSLSCCKNIKGELQNVGELP